MPVVTFEKITRPEQLVEYLGGLLSDSEDLNLKYVAKYDEALIPKYPCVLVQSGQWQKELHGTATYLHTLRADLWVMHANLTVDRKTRSLEDCLLATRVIAALELDKTLGGRIIFGMVELERYAALPARGNKNDGVVSTQLSWKGITQSRFK